MEELREKPLTMFSPEATQEIKKRLSEIELKRIKVIKRIKTAWIVFAITVISLGGIAFVTQNEAFYIPFAIIGVLLLIAAIIITVFSRNKLIEEFKLNILVPSVNKKEDIKYSHNSSITKQEFRQSEIYRGDSVDRYGGEDLFHGMRGKTAYKFSEVHAEEKHTTTDSKGRTKTHYETIFKGIFMIADFNKHLSATTRVVNSGDGFFEKLFAGKSKVTLENPVFEKIFNTYSGSQVEARYILSPAMMERIIELKKRFKSDVNLSFKGNHVYIAIDTSRNHFEPNLANEIGTNQIERIFREIESCLKVIDVLDLNTRIWTKK